MNWQQNLLTNSTEIANLLNETRTIAVLGIKTEGQAGQPAFYVPSYLQTVGFEIIPVPVYYPNATRILGQQVCSLSPRKRATDSTDKNTDLNSLK